MSTKQCTTCGELLPFSDFYKQKSSKDGLRSQCKECHKASSEKAAKKNWKKRLETRRVWARTSPSGNYKAYRQNAKSRGYSFDITLEEFMVYWKQPCHYCGIDIETIGLDRIDNSIGYSVDNLVPCCEDCNRAKRSMTKQEYIALCQRVAASWLEQNKS